MRTEQALSDNIDATPKSSLQRPRKGDQVQQGPTVFHVDEQVDITASSLLTACKRAKYAHAIRTVHSSGCNDGGLVCSQSRGMQDGILLWMAAGSTATRHTLRE